MIRLSRKTGQIFSLCVLVLALPGVAVHANEQFLCCTSIAGTTGAGKTSPSGAPSALSGATLLGCIFTDPAVANQCPVAAQCPTFVCQGPSPTLPPPVSAGKAAIAKDCTCGQIAGECSTGQTSCSGSCVNLTTDTNNCGSCGFACSGASTSCSGGVCGTWSMTINPNSP